jgi:acyl-CoA thioesterase
MSGSVPWQSTVVHPDDQVPGRWHATIDDIWVAAIVPLGGLSAAVAARAMSAELRARGESVAAQRLRSIHCLFAAPVPAGPVEADVTVLRAGRSMSQVQATVRGPEADAGLTALGAFGAQRSGYRFDALTPPDVPPPDACPLFRDPPPPDVDWDPGRRMPLWDTIIDGRPAMGLPPWDRSPRTTAETATWYRFDDQPLDEDGRPDPLALLVLGDLMIGSLGQRIGYTERPWICPSVDLTVHLFDPPGPGWILSHNRARLAGDGYASVESALWAPSGDDGPRLVAHATQQVFFSFPDGAPSPELLTL